MTLRRGVGRTTTKGLMLPLWREIGIDHICPKKHYKILLIEEEEEDHEAEQEDGRSEL